MADLKETNILWILAHGLKFYGKRLFKINILAYLIAELFILKKLLG